MAAGRLALPAGRRALHLCVLPGHAAGRHGLAGGAAPHARLPAGKQNGRLLAKLACLSLRSPGWASLHAAPPDTPAPAALQGLLLRILRGSEDAGTDAGQQRKRQRRCAAPAAALPSASGATDSSMGQPGSSSAAACCWRDTASSCTSSEASADTQQ